MAGLVSDFRAWFKNKKATQPFPYYDGLLMADRVSQSQGPLGWMLIKDPEIDTLAREVWSRYLTGDLLLTQQRVHEGRYVYIAQKRKVSIYAEQRHPI